jgi:hypothetical protein
MNFTQTQKEDAYRLKAVIKRWQAARKAASLPHRLSDLGIMAGGISQPAVTQYANGTIPMNARALELFASALGVAPESISPALATFIPAFSNSRQKLRGIPAPGMVYDWREVQAIMEKHDGDSLPDIFSVDIPVGFFGGVISPGDVAVLSRLDPPRAGDGAIVRRMGGIMEPCIYRPGRKSDYYAQTSDGSLMHSVGDDLEYLFTVIGMPTMRWSRLVF